MVMTRSRFQQCEVVVLVPEYGSLWRDDTFAEASEMSCFLSSHPSQQNSLAASSGRTSNSSLLVSWNCSDLLYLYCCPFKVQS